MTSKNKSRFPLHFLAAIMLFALHSCKTYTCEDHHIGKFVYDVSDFDEVIERTATHQTETSDSLNYKDVFALEWVDECTCRLVFESTNNRARQTISNRDTIYVKMTEVDKDGYFFEAKVLDATPTGRINKVKE